MSDLIGVTVPSDIAEEIKELCGRYQYTGVEPYFTLIAPEKLEGVKGLSRKVQSFCLSHTPVKTIIGGPYIEKGTALNLAVVPNVELKTLRDRIIKHLKLPPAEGLYRLHIPLIREQDGCENKLEEVLADAKRVFLKPRTIIVDSVSIYTKPEGETVYRLKKSYSLSGR